MNVLKTTKYQLLKKTLLKKIQTQEYPVNSLFPSQNMLMRHYRVSYATVSRVLRELQNEGIIERIRGKGSFVKKNIIAPDGKADFVPFNIKAVVSQDFFEPEMTTRGSLDIYQGLLLRASELGLKVQNLTFGDECEVSDSFFDSNDFFFLFNATGYEKKIIPELQRRKIPFVCHGALEYIELGYNFVAVDVRTPSYRVTRELVETGRRKIIFVHEPTKSWTGTGWFAPKIRGYEEAMRDEGLTPRCWSVPFDEASITKALDEYFSKEKPQAILAQTDIHAWKIMDYLKKRKYRIPEDVAVIGYSNLPHSNDNDISLTSIDYPHEKIGRTALDWMIHIRKFPEIVPASKIIETEIFYRNSFCKL
jgi:DNA-binding LacI/PurR family transcriptional regulator